MSMEDHIPSGFVPLANWDIRNRRTNSGHSAEWKMLGDAAKAGKVPGMKAGGSGRWWVHEASASEYLAKLRSVSTPLLSEPAERDRKHSSQQAGDLFPDAAITALVRIDNGISLMQATLDRLATAVETIATQPRTPQQELLHAISSKGFDS